MSLFSNHLTALEKITSKQDKPVHVDDATSTPSKQCILEAVLFSAGRPLSLEDLADIFDDDDMPSRAEIRSLLELIAESFRDSGIELVEVASGYRLQTKKELAPWINRLWEDTPPRLSRALLETLSIIAHRQPVTRSDIEEIRGVAVSSSIIQTFMESQWIKPLGRRDSMGRPTLYGTTIEFLDHFGMKSLEELPKLLDQPETTGISVP